MLIHELTCTLLYCIISLCLKQVILLVNQGTFLPHSRLIQLLTFKAIVQELCRITSEQTDKVQELQLHSGMQPRNTNADSDELAILQQQCGTTSILE